MFYLILFPDFSKCNFISVNVAITWFRINLLREKQLCYCL